MCDLDNLTVGFFGVCVGNKKCLDVLTQAVWELKYVVRYSFLASASVTSFFKKNYAEYLL